MNERPRNYYARIRRDHIALWAEVVDADTGRKVKFESCVWEWTARRCAKRLLKEALAMKPICERVA